MHGSHGHHSPDHGLGHDHGHHHHGDGSARSLMIALAITGTVLVAEVAGALLFNSLALLSDAAHMATDAAALAIALAAIRIGRRPADGRYTYGYRRFEVLAAAFNAVLLLMVAGYVLVEAAIRFARPEPVATTGMMVVAAIGLLANLLSMRLLAASADRSLNLRGAYLEVWADAVGSVAVLAGAVAIRLTGWAWIDPAIGVAIALWVVPRTWVLLRSTVNVLLEGVPTGLRLDEVREGLGDMPGVAGVHDLHVWSLTGQDASCTVHLTLAADADPHVVRTAAVELLAVRFAIDHATVQVEPAGAPCHRPMHA